MFQIKCFAFSTFIVFAILIALFLFYQHVGKDQLSYYWGSDRVIINFCCEGEKCNQTFFDENFDVSSFRAYKNAGFQNKPVVLASFVSRKCIAKFLDDDDSWRFSLTVSNLDLKFYKKFKKKCSMLQESDLKSKDGYIVTSKYCFKNYESHKNEVKWKLLVCRDSIFHYISKFFLQSSRSNPKSMIF